MKAVVFDLDDTLYPERAYAFSGFAAVAEQFSYRLGDPAAAVAAMHRLFDTEHRTHIFNALLGERGMDVTGDLIDAMIDAYRGHCPTIALYPDADTALTRLSVRHRLGIISDGRTAQQSAKVAALALATRVDAIILTDELGPGLFKPHPRAFELMADRLDATHGECAYIADNPAKDFVAPNALGWTTIRVIRPDGIYKNAPIADGGTPQNIIPSLDEIDDLID